MKTVEAVETAQEQQVSVMPRETNAPVVQQQSNISVLAMIADAMRKENFDIAVLEKLVLLQEKMEDREAVKSFNRDFSLMMAEIPIIAKTGWNDFQKTKFAKLEDIVETTRPILSKYGFSVTYKQDQEMIKGDPSGIICMMTVKCVLKHRDSHEESNQTILPIIAIKGQTPIQAMGMGSSYGRRYTLMQALNIATAGSDTDGVFPEFAKVAGTEKKPIKDDRLNKAIELAKTGEVDLIRQVFDKHELTEEQKDFVNGQLFGVKEND